MQKPKVKKPKKVLCYLDLSKPSHEIVAYAHMVAQKMEAELFVLHTVTDIGRSAGFYVPHINTDKLAEEMTKAAQDKLYGICSQSIGDLDTAHRLVRRGDALEVIDEIITAKSIDLLVLGHAVGALSLFKADHALRYLKHPHCPVLIVPVTGE